MENNSAVLSGPSDEKKWTVSVIIAVAFLLLSSAYIYHTAGEAMTLSAFSAALAVSASFMFAMSFSASSFSYYFGWPNMRHGYQKQIGVTAFWLSYLYCVTLLILYPEIYYYGFFRNLLTPDLLLGLTAMFIFGAMTVINSKSVAPYFSWDTIKFVLGLGLVGYALLVMRAVLLEWPLWEHWFLTLEGYPPRRLILSALAMAVLFFRLSIPIHIALLKKNR
jgi:hypothetical protein